MNDIRRLIAEGLGTMALLAIVVGSGIMGERLAGHMVRDKKREGGRTAFILARGIGQAFVDKNVELADVAAFLDRAP